MQASSVTSRDGQVRFVTAWVVTNTVFAGGGLLFAQVCYSISTVVAHNPPESIFLFPLLILGVFGGGAQTLLLMRIVPAVYRWVFLTVFGSIVALVAMTYLKYGLLSGGDDIDPLVEATIFGTIVGACQWLLLRHFSLAALWIVASAFGFVTGFGASVIGIEPRLLLLFIAPIPYSIVTGLAMLALIRYSSPVILPRATRSDT